MPELPEVETIVRGLRPTIIGRTITAVRLGKTDFIDHPERLERRLPGRRIEEVTRFGKFVLLRMGPTNGTGNSSPGDEPSVLLVHLGMTGQFFTRKPAEPVPAHTHVVFSLDDGQELRYTDARRFGRMALVADDELQEILGLLGQDPLDIGLPEFCAQLRGRRAMIKALLLNQGALRGIGNIYADESLWRAKIHPARQAARLSRLQLESLYRSLRHVLQQAIRLRGSSISDFVDAMGVPGEYQMRHRVYGREGRPCFRCGAQVRRVMIAGRSSHFCPQCQRAPRRYAHASKLAGRNALRRKN